MKNKIIRVALMAIATVAMGSLAFASNINCAGPGSNTVTVPDVTTLTGSNTCSVIGSNLIFSNFNVSPTGGAAGATVGIAAPSQGTGVSGNDVNLEFQLSGVGSGTGDILLTYTVTGPVTGLDINLQATPLVTGGSVTITEIGCSVAFVGGACQGTTYANFSATSTSGSFANPSVSLIGGTESLVYIKKDISFSGATVSEFENSHASTVPEPMTLSLLGAGLLGLGLASRRLRS